MGKFRYQHLRGTTEQWEVSSIVPLKGELVIEECADGTFEIKIGDGENTFKNLPYVSGAAIEYIDLRDSNIEESSLKVTTTGIEANYTDCEIEFNGGDSYLYSDFGLKVPIVAGSNIEFEVDETNTVVKINGTVEESGTITTNGGFQAGTSATATYGGAVGSRASAGSGGAVGSDAAATLGGAVGLYASATTGGAVGGGAAATTGFAGGYQAKARYAADGHTEIDDAVAIGYNAKAQASNTVQLGTGTNANENTLQFRSYQLVDANGKIPSERLPGADSTDYAAKSHTHGNINNSGQITATESTTSNVKHIAVCVDDNGTVKKMTPTNVRTAIGAGTSSLTLAGNGSATTAAKSDHTHNYAGSSSAGGSATSAVKLDTVTAGSATQPVYFTDGKPTACTYTLEKSVPSDAKFTDTTYSNATTSAAGLMSAADKTIINRFTYDASIPSLSMDGGASSIALNDDVVYITAGGGLYHGEEEVAVKSDIPTYSAATQSVAGLMSAADKTKLDNTYGANTITSLLVINGDTSATAINDTGITCSINEIEIEMGGGDDYNYCSGQFEVPIVAGSNISITKNDNGKAEISATDTTYSAATQSAAGLMSAADKKKLDGIGNGTITLVDSDGNEIGSFSLNQSSNATITIPSGGTNVIYARLGNEIY